MRGIVKQLPSGRWIARYRDAEGRRQAQTFDRHTEATNYLNSLAEAPNRLAEAGERMQVVGRRLTLAVTLPIVVIIVIVMLVRAIA